jgi:hypothetical protein
MFNQFILNKKIFNLLIFFLIASWIHQWISIGSFLRLDFFSLNFDIKAFLSKRNFSLILLPLNLVLFFLLYKKINSILIIFFILSISYLIGSINYEKDLYISEIERTQVLEIYSSLNLFKRSMIEELATPIVGMLLSILILCNLYSTEQRKNKEIILMVNLIMLLMIVFLIFFQKGNLGTNPVYTLNLFGSSTTITSNGISRSLIILFIFFFSKSIVKKNKINYVLIFISALFSYLVIANEGRLNVICLISAIIVILIISDFNFTKKIFVFFLIFIFPLIITVMVKLQAPVNSDNDTFIIIEGDNIFLDEINKKVKDNNSNLKIELNKKGQIKIFSKDRDKRNILIEEIKGLISNNYKSDKSIIIESSEKQIIIQKDGINIKNKKVEEMLTTIRKNRLFKFQGEIRGRDLGGEPINYNFGSTIHNNCQEIYNSNFNKTIDKINFLTTGRIKKWICALKLNNDIFGNGPEYDRKILNNDANLHLVQGQDVANAILYGFLSGGLIAVVCLLVIIYKYLSLCFKFLILKKNYYLKDNYLFLGSLVTSGYLIGRGFFENGFAAFSIDYLIIISCLTFIFSEFNNLKKIH